MKQNLQYTESRNAQSTTSAVVSVTNLKNRLMPRIGHRVRVCFYTMLERLKVLYIRPTKSLHYLLQNSLMLHFQIMIVVQI